MSYKWNGSGPLRRNSGPYVYPGETFEPTADELDSFGDLIREEGDVDPPDPTLPDPPFDPGAFTVPELREQMADGEYSDAEREALEQAESEGQNRTTAKEAITGLR